MNERERYLKTLLFDKPDKIPFEPGKPRESTRKAWYRQGLPEGRDWEEVVRERIGIEPKPKREEVPALIKHEMIPFFDERIIQEKEYTHIVQDWKGNICEISKEYDVSYLRVPKDFVTRKWLRCPVEKREDWELMKKRYYADTPERIPSDIKGLAKKFDKRDFPLGLNIPGPFWQMREWLGFERLCIFFIDEPDLIKDMAVFWKKYISALLKKILPYIKLDFVCIAEDMAYKGRAMISPAMTRKFLSGCYRAWNEIIKVSACPLSIIDSDGFISELLPVWIDCGFNATYPLEVAAGNDITELRKTYDKKMAFIGGVDKRAIARGGEVIKNEMARIEEVVKSGGYIPGCDHGVPPDISWDNFLEYSKILARLTR